MKRAHDARFRLLSSTISSSAGDLRDHGVPFAQLPGGHGERAAYAGAVLPAGVDDHRLQGDEAHRDVRRNTWARNSDFELVEFRISRF